MPHIDTPRGRIWFADQRQKDHDPAPVLLLIHGAGGSHLDWHMSLRKMNAIVPDLPGHGKSDPPGRDSIDDYAADIIALMDALQIQRAVICGHSMGGAIAQTMALAYPERVQSLILIGTGALLAVNQRILETVVSAPAEVGEWLKKWMWGKGTPDSARENGLELFLKNNPEVVYGDYVACNRFDVRDRLPQIPHKTLVIGATGDKMTPLKLSEALAEGIPDAQLVIIEDAGHMMALEQPAQVADAVGAWLTSL